VRAVTIVIASLLSHHLVGSLSVTRLKAGVVLFRANLQFLLILFRTDCVFSPNDRLLLTGVSVKKNAGPGKLVLLDRTDLEVVSELSIAESVSFAAVVFFFVCSYYETTKSHYQHVLFCSQSVVRCIWHPKLNQIVVGTGDGDVKVLYDPDRSSRGAKLCVVKKRKKINQAEVFIRHKIITRKCQALQICRFRASWLIAWARIYLCCFAMARKTGRRRVIPIFVQTRTAKHCFRVWKKHLTGAK